MLTNTLKTLKSSPTLLINEESKKLIAQGQDIIKFGFGQSPFPVPPSVVEALKQYAHEKDYLPATGLYALRAAVAGFNQRTLNINTKPENVTIGPGSKELIFDLQFAFDGDLILPAPSWVSYEPQASMLGKKVWWVDTTEENSWLMTPDQLEQVCQNISNPNKLLILNYPSNPTGVSYPIDQMKALVSVFRKYNILLIADEIYAEITFKNEHNSFATYYPEATIISGGLSKWCGAGGWRVGTFTFPESYSWLQNAMSSIASETFSAVSAPIQYAAVTAFEGNEEIDIYLKKSKRILSAVAEYMRNQLIALDLSMPSPTGGFYLFPNFKNHTDKLNIRGIFTSTDLCKNILNETGIALLPGSAFGRPQTEFTTRLSFVDFNGDAVLSKLKPNDIISEHFLTEHFPKLIIAIQRMQSWLNH